MLCSARAAFGHNRSFVQEPVEPIRLSLPKDKPVVAEVTTSEFGSRLEEESVRYLKRRQEMEKVTPNNSLQLTLDCWLRLATPSLATHQMHPNSNVVCTSSGGDCR